MPKGSSSPTSAKGHQDEGINDVSFSGFGGWASTVRVQITPERSPPSCLNILFACNCILWLHRAASSHGAESGFIKITLKPHPVI